jgi:Mg-chelatase subunit ChlD
MKIKLLGVALFMLTFGAVLYYPMLQARDIPIVDPHDVIVNANSQPVIDVVFVLDTTGSMSGLIQTAKDKIWSIATTMASAQPTPRIRIGLVAYRDRGDAYVTQTVDLSEDLDSVYAELMDFQAGGGGDAPESVNAALSQAVNRMAWSNDDQAYRAIFLVGDAPPHMDYQDEQQYPAIMAAARQKGIVVNAIQCGDFPATLRSWNSIASLGSGKFFQVEQAGGAVAYSTPYDTELAALTAKLDATRLYYGTVEEKEAMAAKKSATDKLSALASDEAKARRGVFNLSAAGRTNLLGKNELVEDVASGKLDLDAVEKEMLPAAIQPMASEEQRAYVMGLAEERAQVKSRMRELAESRDDYLKEKVEADGGAGDSLDQKLYDTISRQAGAAGLTYEEGPAY